PCAAAPPSGRWEFFLPVPFLNQHLDIRSQIEIFGPGRGGVHAVLRPVGGSQNRSMMMRVGRARGSPWAIGLPRIWSDIKVNVDSTAMETGIAVKFPDF